LQDFEQHDIGSKGELDAHEVTTFLEHIGSSKITPVLLELVSAMDIDRSIRLSFVEWCCALYTKSYEELNKNFLDDDVNVNTPSEASKEVEVEVGVETVIAEKVESPKIEKNVEVVVSEIENKSVRIFPFSYYLFHLTCFHFRLVWLTRKPSFCVKLRLLWTSQRPMSRW
jgi:hypothetical protein